MPWRNVIDRVGGWRRPRSSALVAQPAPTPLGLWALLPLNGLAFVVALSLVVSPRPPEVAGFLLVLFAAMNSLFAATIAYRLQGYELPANRRAHVRLMVDLEATLDGAPCQVWDISLGGANIITSARTREIVGEQQLTIPIQGELLTFRTEAVRASEQRGGTDVALRYLGGQDAMTARLAIALLSEASHEAASETHEDGARAA